MTWATVSKHKPLRPGIIRQSRLESAPAIGFQRFRASASVSPGGYLPRSAGPNPNPPHPTAGTEQPGQDPVRATASYSAPDGGTILPLGVQSLDPALTAPNARSPWPAARHVVHVPFRRFREPSGPGRDRCPAETGRQERGAGGSIVKLGAPPRPGPEITRGRVGWVAVAFAAALVHCTSAEGRGLAISSPIKSPGASRPFLARSLPPSRADHRQAHGHGRPPNSRPRLRLSSYPLRKASSGRAATTATARARTRSHAHTETERDARWFGVSLLPGARGAMAQRDKKEEPTELRAPEITLCANNCGFPGNPATQNLCQSCFSASRSSSSSSSQPSPTLFRENT